MKDKDRVALLYRKYQEEIGMVLPEAVMDYPQFAARLSEKLADMPFIEAETDDQYGFLYYQCREDDIAHIMVPMYGYYAEEENAEDHENCSDGRSLYR